MHYGDDRQMLSSLEGLNAYAEPGEALGAKRGVSSRERPTLR